MREVFTHRSNGKLLLTGEYLVLEGAMALALPLLKGQTLRVWHDPSAKPGIQWKSLFMGCIFLDAVIHPGDFTVVSSSQAEISEKLIQILRFARQANPSFLTEPGGFQVLSEADFEPDWGLGSSSTLVVNIAAWAETDPFELNRQVFNGSGYDVACALHSSPLLYKLFNGKPVVHLVNYQPAFSQQLYFAYLGRKQDSRKGVAAVIQQLKKLSPSLLEHVGSISEKLLQVSELHEFIHLLKEHDQLVSGVTGMKTIREERFHAMPGYVKSLGAWGGDFVLVCWERSFAELKEYLSACGVTIVFPYHELVLVK